MNSLLKYGAPPILGVFLGILSVSFAGFIVGLFIGIVLVQWDLNDERKKAQAAKAVEEAKRRERAERARDESPIG